MRTDLKKGEIVALVIRSHWILLVGPILLTVLGFLLALLLGSYTYIIPVLLFCYLAYKILERNNNLWAITNLRVIDEFGVFTLNSKESPLDKINNVTYNQTVWGRIFGYGSVQIQTAAEIGSTTYNMVEKPKELKDTITLMQEEYKRIQIKSQAQELANAISKSSQKQSKTDIATEIEKLYNLKEKGIISEEEFNVGKKKILKE